MESLEDKVVKFQGEVSNHPEFILITGLDESETRIPILVVTIFVDKMFPLVSPLVAPMKWNMCDKFPWWVSKHERSDSHHYGASWNEAKENDFTVRVDLVKNQRMLFSK